jgi:hypothetical protein
VSLPKILAKSISLYGDQKKHLGEGPLILQNFKQAKVGFKRKACLHNAKLTGESVSAYKEATEEVITNLAGITEEGVIPNTKFLMLMIEDYFGKRYCTNSFGQS